MVKARAARRGATGRRCSCLRGLDASGMASKEGVRQLQPALGKAQGPRICTAQAAPPHQYSPSP